jgi:conjugative transfer signal peptidase TraF
MVEHRDLPLLAWGEALRAAKARRRRLARRGLLVGILCLGLGATIIARPRPRLVWNASASAPLGLYRVEPARPARRGDMVIARMPVALRGLAARRRYLPANVPLVKRVVGAKGDRVCATGATIAVNGRPVATRRLADPLGRRLPWWQGCRTLADGALFLLMAEAPNSFDGRYFGPTAPGDVIGKAIPLWVR